MPDPVRDDVLNVLASNGVGISGPGADGEYVLAKGGTVETHVLPEKPGKKFLHYLQRKFGVPIHQFFHPEMAEKASNPPREGTED